MNPSELHNVKTTLLKNYKIKNGRLHHLRGPLAGKPAGHRRPHGQIYIIFEGYRYKHDDLLFLYSEQLKSKELSHVNTSTPHDYRTISGQIVHFYTKEYSYNAPPYVIHGAIKIKDRWHACQWTDKGEALQPEYNLEKIK